MEMEDNYDALIESFRQRANIPLPEPGEDSPPAAESLEELAEMLGAVEVDVNTFERVANPEEAAVPEPEPTEPEEVIETEPEGGEDPLEPEGELVDDPISEQLPPIPIQYPRDE